MLRSEHPNGTMGISDPPLSQLDAQKLHCCLLNDATRRQCVCSVK